MEIYIFTLVILLIFSIIEIRFDLTEMQHRGMSIFVYCFLVFQVGFRWQTGTDWDSYLNNFTGTTSYTDVLNYVIIGFEIGYGIFVYLIRLFTTDYTVFLVLHAVIYYFLVLKSTNFLSPYPFLSTLIFYVSTMGILGSNRQLIAMAICFYSLQFIINEKKPWKFFILVSIAFLFHTTALLFLVYYFLNRDFDKRIIVLALLVAILIGKSSLPNFLFLNFSDFLGETSANKAQMYVGRELSKTALSITGLIRRLFFFFLFLISYDKMTLKFPTYKLLFNGFTLGIMIYFMFSSTFVILVGRGGYYFSVMECFLLASLLLLFDSRRDRAYVMIALFVYSYFIFFQSISEYPRLFLPYKGIYINSSFIRRF
ncbi:EpsG family protein [Flavobacterium sp.]|uniref:EpsG family protein n=1 Tax=Flavobacterium sp. TaxID=239 RepID=UPI00286D7844|nr:EpsG family protein [Flavobacterium sp.]